MKLLLERTIMTPTTTIGKLYINGIFQCYTLEDTDRKLEDGGEKIKGQTAIPRGTYKVLLTWSPRFKRVLPLLVDVPHFTGVRLHAGNDHEDTEGCPLVGTGTDNNTTLFNSRAAMEVLMHRLEAAEQNGEEIEIEVR